MATNKDLFSHLRMAPVDPILGTALAYKADTNPNKVNLGIGAYRTEDGKPLVLPIVMKAEKEVLAMTGSSIDKEYAPVDGVPGLPELTQRLIFGSANKRIASTQTLSGTGSLRVVGEFIKTFLKKDKIYCSDPTWDNHHAIFNKSGLATEKYPYWDAAKKSFRFNDFLSHLRSSDEGSVYLMHACAHNPTGVDPNMDQWKEVTEVCQKKNHLLIVDSAYQGYASGSLEYDRKAIEMMIASGMQLFVCQSFAKNLGLYGERIGMLHAVCKDEQTAKIVLSQLKMVIRPMYSSPPVHGALLVKQVLGNEENFQQWTQELKDMADRILEVRKLLRFGLEEKGTPGTWNHITDQIGMFSFTGLSPEQCTKMIEEHHIYMLKTGRISLAGLNKGNVRYVVDAIDAVVRLSTSAGTVEAPNSSPRLCCL